MAKPKEEYKKNVQPASIANLKPANRNGMRHTITKRYMEVATELLVTNHSYFLEQIAQLSPKDYAMVHLKLMDLVLPKKIEAEVNESEKPSWVIQLASTVLPTHTIEDANIEEDENDDNA